MASKLSDIFLGLSPSMKIGGQSTVATLAPSAVPFTTANRTLPMGAGSYSSPVVAQPQTPVAPKAPAVVMPQAGVQSPTQPTGVNYDKYRNPVTGAIMSPTEYADFLAKRVTSGSIPNYAGDALANPNPTSAELMSSANNLNNQRNDIATGTTDPYNVASKSGIAYSPAEMAAIEKAYAGIYDPALNDVFAKLDKKQKEDAAALENKNKLEQMAKQHQYDIELKQTPSGGTGTSGTYAGVYTPGENPTVDAWAQRIFEGSSKITDIPASDKGLRNAVTVALQAYGNQADGRPTTTEIGLQTLDAAKRLMTMFDKGQGTAAVGTSRIFGGSIALPGSDVANFKNLFENLIANRSLEGVKFLKGQGQVSDAERLLLKNAMSELNLNQSEDAFKKSLQAIIDKLEGNSVSPLGSSAGGVLRSPDGTQEVSVADLTPAQLEEAKAAGWK